MVVIHIPWIYLLVVWLWGVGFALSLGLAFAEDEKEENEEMDKKAKRAEARLKRLDELREINGWTYDDIQAITGSSVTTIVSWFRTPGTSSARTVPETVLRLLESQAVIVAAESYIVWTAKRLNENSQKRLSLDTLIPELRACIYTDSNE